MLFTSNKKKVTIKDFELIKNLGYGAHGKVVLCERKFGEKKLFAMKILKKMTIIEKNQLEHTKAEQIVLSHVNHPFLVSLKYSFQTNEKLYFIMEFMKGGELFQHLTKMKKFTEGQTKFIAACLIMAIGHMHNKDYIYRDLKPENILFTEEGYIKLTDFGLAKFVTKKDIANTFCGTPEYMAPEVITDKGCNRPADWWSLGIVLYEMIFGIPPFYSSNIQKMYRKTIMKDLRFKKHTQCSEEAKDFIYHLLIKDPKRRLGSIADSLEVMSHSWFKNFDWKALMDKSLTPPYNPMKGRQWEDNFDQNYLKKKPTDSICQIDPETIQKFQKEFEDFDLNLSDLEIVDEEGNAPNQENIIQNDQEV